MKEKDKAALMAEFVKREFEAQEKLGQGGDARREQQELQRYCATLQQARECFGWQRAELAERLGLPETQLYLMETGKAAQEIYQQWGKKWLNALQFKSDYLDEVLS